MAAMLKKYGPRLLNMALRLASLGAKLLLTLYMARYLSLQGLGVFGLVNGAVVTLMTALGIRFDYIAARDLVGTKPYEALSKMRDQAVFYALNYAVLAAIMLVLTLTDVTGVAPRIMLIIYILAVMENCAGMTFANLTSLGHPLFANGMFFVRSGLWVFPVIALGFMIPAYRTDSAIFCAWGLGLLLSLVITVWAGRGLPWQKVMSTPVDWGWLKDGVRKCFFIWLGSLGGTIGWFVDRFVVADFKGLELAGVATFYTSFGTALFALVHSGVLSFAYPRVIALHKEKNKTAFWHEVRSVGWHVALSAGFIAIVLAIAVPWLGHVFHREEFVEQAPTLWLILLGTWLRCNAETFYYVLFARHQDRAVWLGDLLFLVPTFGCNVVLVPMYGFIGIGYSAVIAAFLLLLWRVGHVLSYKNA
ncbi:MAG TPA: hypothetical protein VFR09_00330 [Alphaproteobacteria bacterium]|nr:hypothetical protein [Alphaproteobacteria bacterium]